MGSHKQRVQRKIKKDVKRKLQSKPRPQKPTNKMDEMMKLMMLMKGGGQQNPNAAQDLLTAKEIIAKKNAEEARKQREQKQRIKQIEAEEKTEKMKAKTQQLTAKEQQLRAMEEIQKQKREAEAKLRNTKDEIERKKLEAEVARLNQKHELEQQTLDLMLQSQKLDEESVKKKHLLEEKRGEHKKQQLELQIKQKQFEIEDSEAEAKELADKLTKIKAAVTEHSKINTRGKQKYQDFIAALDETIKTLNTGALKSMVDISTAKDQIKNLQKYNIDKLIGTGSRLNTELKKVLRETNAELNDLTEDNERLRALNKENKHLQRDIANTQLGINLENAQTRTKDGKLQVYVQTTYKGKDGSVATAKRWKNAEDVDWNVDKPVERNIAKELETAEVDNKQYKTIKKQKDAEYERNEKDLIKIDELNADSKKINAYNTAMGDVEYEDKSAEIAKLEYEIKNLQEQINDKWTQRADYNKMLRQIKELENKKTALAQELANTPTKTISEKQIKEHADAMYGVADTEDKINARRKKNESVDNFENETEQLQLNNKIKKQVLDKMDDKSNENNLKTIVVKRVEAELQEKQLAAQQEAKDAEEKLKIAKWKEEALNSENIKASNEKIKQAHINKAEYEEEAKQRERLRNAQQNALNAKVMAEVQAQLNPAFTSAQSVTEAETLFQQANDKYNRAIDDMKSERDYVHDKANSIMARLTNDAPLRQRVAGILAGRGFDIDNQDWFNQNLTNRIRADAFANAVDSVYSHFDQEQQVWDDAAIDADEGIGNYLDEGDFNIHD